MKFQGKRIKPKSKIEKVKEILAQLPDDPRITYSWFCKTAVQVHFATSIGIYHWAPSRGTIWSVRTGAIKGKSMNFQDARNAINKEVNDRKAIEASCEMALDSEMDRFVSLPNT